MPAYHHGLHMPCNYGHRRMQTSLFVVSVNQDEGKIISQVYTIPRSGDKGYSSQFCISRVSLTRCMLLLNIPSPSLAWQKKHRLTSTLNLLLLSSVISEFKIKLDLSSKATQHLIILDVI